MAKKVNQIKKLENGKIAVQWHGKDKKFYVIEDSEISNYLIYCLVHTPKEVVDNINSKCQ